MWSRWLEEPLTTQTVKQHKLLNNTNKSLFLLSVKSSPAVVLIQAVADLGWSQPTLIQEKAIPLALEGKDLLARARTGSGKTAAYAMPVIQRILASKQVSGKPIMADSHCGVKWIPVLGWNIHRPPGFMQEQFFEDISCFCTTWCSSIFTAFPWLPVATRIRFKTLVLGPVYIQDMVKRYTPAQHRLVAPSLRANHSTKSRLFAVLAPKWHQDSRKSTHLPPQSKNTPFPTIPWIQF